MTIAPTTRNHFTTEKLPEIKPSLFKFTMMALLAIQGGVVSSLSAVNNAVCSLNGTAVSTLPMSFSHSCSVIQTKYPLEAPSVTNFWNVLSPSTLFLAFKEEDVPCIEFEKENRLSEREVVVLLRDHYSEKVVGLLKEHKYFTPISVIPHFQDLNSRLPRSEQSSDISAHAIFCRFSMNSALSCSRDYGCFQSTQDETFVFCRNKFGCFSTRGFDIKPTRSDVMINFNLCCANGERSDEHDQFFSFLQEAVAMNCNKSRVYLDRWNKGAGEELKPLGFFFGGFGLFLALSSGLVYCLEKKLARRYLM